MPRVTKATLQAEIEQLKAKIAELEFANYIREGRWTAFNSKPFSSYSNFRGRPMAAFQKVDIRLVSGTELYDRAVMLIDWDIMGTDDEVVYYRPARGIDTELLAASRIPGWVQPEPAGNT